MAQSRHPDRVGECLLSGVKRTSQFDRAMSAFDPKRTSPERERNRFSTSPIPIAARSQNLQWSFGVERTWSNAGGAAV